eukprot:scaffold1202_cov18-Prasinocladus_malaysianus.AAC.1
MLHRTPASAVRTHYPALVRNWNPNRSARSEEDSSERTNGLTRHRSRSHVRVRVQPELAARKTRRRANPGGRAVTSTRTGLSVLVLL